MEAVGPELLGRIFDEHAAALALYARQWSDSPEDVVQEAIIQLARQRPPPDCIAAWLYRVVRNGAISAGKSEQRRKGREYRAASQRPAWFQNAAGGLDAETAAAALQELPAEERETVVARLWGGLSFEQVGELMGVSSSTAHRRYMAALASLRERLGLACPANP